MNIHALYITHHGDDWEDFYTYLKFTKEECEKLKQEHYEEHKNVFGIEHISFEIQELSVESVINQFRVDTLAELFGEEIKTVLLHHITAKYLNKMEEQ